MAYIIIADDMKHFIARHFIDKYRCCDFISEASFYDCYLKKMRYTGALTFDAIEEATSYIERNALADFFPIPE